MSDVLPDHSTPRLIMVEGVPWVSHEFHQRCGDELQDVITQLRAENERLRETLKAIGPSFPSHHIDSEKGGRWIEYGDGDGYFDDGDVHTEDCPACALGRRIDEALGSPDASDEEKAT